MTKTCCGVGRKAYPGDCPEHDVDLPVLNLGTVKSFEFTEVPQPGDDEPLRGPEPVVSNLERETTVWSASAVRYFRWGKCSTEGCERVPKYRYWFEESRAEQPFGACEPCATNTRTLLSSFRSTFTMRRL